MSAGHPSLSSITSTTPQAMVYRTISHSLTVSILNTAAIVIILYNHAYNMWFQVCSNLFQTIQMTIIVLSFHCKNIPLTLTMVLESYDVVKLLSLRSLVCLYASRLVAILATLLLWHFSLHCRYCSPACSVVDWSSTRLWRFLRWWLGQCHDRWTQEGLCGQLQGGPTHIPTPPHHHMITSKYSSHYTFS